MRIKLQRLPQGFNVGTDRAGPRPTRPTAASVSLAWCLERFLLLARSQHNDPTSNGLEPVSGGGVSINHLLLPALLRLIIMTL